jgi:hypothetical protein
VPIIVVRATDAIPAPAGAVYSVLADYREGHPAVVPKRHFPWMAVEEGGVGEGTIIRFGLHLPGLKRTVRAVITEPEPGRLLAERDLETGALTTFLVEPVGPREARVTIETTWQRAGLAGWVERLLAPSFLERIYAEELSNLALYCRLRFPEPDPQGGTAPGPAGASVGNGA